MKEKIELIVKAFLLSSPFIDMLTAFALHSLKIDLTMGIIVRVLFLIFSLWYLFFIYKGEQKKLYKGFSFSLIIYIALFFGIVLLDKGKGAIIYEAKNTIKTFYFPFLLITFSAMFEEKLDIIPKKYFTYIIVTYLLGIFIPSLLGIGFDTYEITKKGSLGFFSSANEVGGIISILMPFFFLNLYKDSNFIKIMLGVTILVYVLLSMGTKTPLLAFIIILSVYLLIFLYKMVKIKNYKKVLGVSFVSLITIITLLLIIPKTTFYKNIKIHLDFLEVDNITDIFKSEELIDHFIFSSRLKFMKNSVSYYNNAPLLEKLGGIGYIEGYGTDKLSLKTVEMDYVDIFLRHGIIGSIIYLIIYLYFIREALKRYKKAKDFDKKITYQISFLLTILLSFFTGHIIMAPAVSILVVLILTAQDKKGELI